MASSATSSPSRSERSVDENGSTGTKSTVPAIVVFSPSVGKRVMVRMPDLPAVSFFQLSALPAPSEVTTPMPVTTTIGLPNLSRVAVMFPPCDHLIASTSAMPSPRQWPAPITTIWDGACGHFNLEPRSLVGRKQRAARDRQRRQRQPQRKLRFHGVAEHRAGRPHRKIRMGLQEGAFFRRDGLGAGRAGDDGGLVCRSCRASTTAFPASTVTSPGCLRRARSATTLVRRA